MSPEVVIAALGGFILGVWVTVTYRILWSEDRNRR